VEYFACSSLKEYYLSADGTTIMDFNKESNIIFVTVYNVSYIFLFATTNVNGTV